LNFDIRIFHIFNIGPIELWLTETIVFTWVIMAILIAFAIIVRIKLNKFSENPKGFQNIVETMVEAFDKFVRNIAGDKLSFVGNWYFTIFAFLLLSNISGILFMRPPTADWSMTFMLAICTFIIIQGTGIMVHRMNYVKNLFKPYPFFFPLNVIGELSRPISLSFRLFGNIVAGVILIGLVYFAAPLRWVVPVPLHIFFDLFLGALQAYVFVMLSLSFVGAMADKQEEEVIEKSAA